jgi:lysine-N-methylase
MPPYLKELTDLNDENAENGDYDIVVTPFTVEYVMFLRNPDVVRKLVSYDGPLSYRITYLPEEEENKYAEEGKRQVMENPITNYYYLIRIMTMKILQDREIVFEKRLLLLNYAFRTMQGMIDKGQHSLIPGFIAEFQEYGDYNEPLEYFKDVSLNVGRSLYSGIAFLKSLNKKSPAFKEILNSIYKNLGVSGPETLDMADMNKYVSMRAGFDREYMQAKPHYLENIMINYLWTYSIPYTFKEISVWEHFAFYISLYNALKVMLACLPGIDGEGFVKAVSSFDAALNNTGRDYMKKVVMDLRHMHLDGNGDVAELTVS